MMTPNEETAVREFLYDLTVLKTEEIPVWPIPSYGIKVMGYAIFTESERKTVMAGLRAKRKAVVVVTSTGGSQSCSATVWAYTRDLSTILGPFTATCEIPLEIDIDESEWNILLYTTTEEYADVFTDME